MAARLNAVQDCMHVCIVVLWCEMVIRMYSVQNCMHKLHS